MHSPLPPLPPPIPHRKPNTQTKQVLRAHTAPKRVCNSCIQSCWTPRAAKDPTAASSSAGKPQTLSGKDDRRVSLTVSTCDANACETDATATAPLSPGTPAAAGFFPGLATPSGPESSAVEEGTTTVNKQSSDNRPTSSRRHRRQASVAMPPPSLQSAAISSASTMPPPPPALPLSATGVALPPPTPAGDNKDEADGDGYSGTPSSASIGGCDNGPTGNARQLGPFFGGRPRSRRESSGGRLEGSGRGGGVGRWAGAASGGALGGGIFGNGYIEDVDMEVEDGEDGPQVEEIRAKHQHQHQASSSTRPATMPVLPEEVATVTAAVKNDTTKQQQLQSEEEEYDNGEGGPMMMNISGWPGVALGAVAIGSGVAVAVVVRSAFSLVFFY